MSLVQAMLAATLKPLPTSVAQAVRSNSATRARFGRDGVRAADPHRDTFTRRKMRALLNGAGLADASVQIAFIKNNGELRYMLAHVVPDCDSTKCYVTVVDMEREVAGEDNVFRRINLDAVVSCRIEFDA